MADFVVREARPEDAAQVIAHIKRIAEEPNNGISISSADEFRYTEEEEAVIIEKAASSDDRLMIVAEASGQIIGVASCTPGNQGYRHTLGLGITVNAAWRDKGVGTAMLECIIDWCKNNATIHRLELWVFPDNKRAISLYEKVGFEHEGNRRGCFLKDGKFQDLMLMGMIFER